MGYKEAVGAKRRREGPTRCAFGRIFELVGGGARIRFWHDVWCEEAALKSSFLELYSITCDKEALVSDYLDSSGTYIHCNPSFIKAIQDWEQESLVSFLNLIFASKTHLRDADRIL